MVVSEFILSLHFISLCESCVCHALMAKINQMKWELVCGEEFLSFCGYRYRYDSLFHNSNKNIKLSYHHIIIL